MNLRTSLAALTLVVGSLMTVPAFAATACAPVAPAVVVAPAPVVVPVAVPGVARGWEVRHDVRVERREIREIQAAHRAERQEYRAAQARHDAYRDGR